MKDSGNGFPEGWQPDLNHSFGYQLIKAFSKKLKAKMKVYNDHGAVIELQISKYKMSES
jgi:two-component sensor histidine kinase